MKKIKNFKMAAKENCGKVSLTFQKDWSEKFGEIQVRKLDLMKSLSGR